jgi:acetate kinase
VIDNLAEIDVVGHRVVHGGQEYRQATLITPQVKDAIANLSSFAPVQIQSTWKDLPGSSSFQSFQVDWI